MRTTLTFVTALIVVAIAAPSASARPIDSVPANASRSTPRPTVTRIVDDGIDLGSAALGAGGAGALLMLTAAGAVTVIHRRRHTATSRRRTSTAAG
jgi:hypothetical protein